MVRYGSLRILHKSAYAAPAKRAGGPPKAEKRRRRSSLVVLGLATDTLFTTVKCGLTTNGKLSCMSGAPPSLVARGIMVLTGSRVVEPSKHAAASGRGFDIHLEAGDVLTVLPELCDAEAAAFAADVFTLSGGGEPCRPVIMSGRLRKLRPGKSRRSSISKVVRSVVHGGARARYQDRLCSLIEDKLTTALYLHYTDRDDKPPIDLRYADVVEPSTNPDLHGRGMDIRTLRGGEIDENKVFTFDEFDGDEASEGIFQAVLDFVEPRMQARAKARKANAAIHSPASDGGADEGGGASVGARAGAAGADGGQAGGEADLALLAARRRQAAMLGVAVVSAAAPPAPLPPPALATSPAPAPAPAPAPPVASANVTKPKQNPKPKPSAKASSTSNAAEVPPADAVTTAKSKPKPKAPKAPKAPRGKPKPKRSGAPPKPKPKAPVSKVERKALRKKKSMSSSSLQDAIDGRKLRHAAQRVRRASALFAPMRMDDPIQASATAERRGTAELSADFSALLKSVGKFKAMDALPKDGT